MTDDELDRLDALAQAATPGPWLTPEEAGDSNDPRIPLDHEGMYVWPWHHEADMRLAYASRTAILAQTSFRIWPKLASKPIDTSATVVYSKGVRGRRPDEQEDRTMATMTEITLTATIQRNRGGHPFVELCEDSPAFAALRAIDGKYLVGSSLSGAKTFTTPVVVTVNGEERIVTGVGAIYREETVTRERNPRNGKIRETVVKGPACCYAYLDESPVSRRSYGGGAPAEDREQWEQNPAGSASDAARREDY